MAAPAASTCKHRGQGAVETETIPHMACGGPVSLPGKRRQQVTPDMTALMRWFRSAKEGLVSFSVLKQMSYSASLSRICRPGQGSAQHCWCPSLHVPIRPEACLSCGWQHASCSSSAPAPATPCLHVCGGQAQTLVRTTFPAPVLHLRYHAGSEPCVWASCRCKMLPRGHFNTSQLQGKNTKLKRAICVHCQPPAKAPETRRLG